MSTGERPASRTSPVFCDREPIPCHRAVDGLPRQARPQIPPPWGGRPPQGAAETSPEPAGRYYQLLTGHAAIGTFLHERMTGA